MRKVIDEHGEIVDELYEGDRIIRKSTYEYLGKRINIHGDANFIKVYSKPLFDLADDLTGNESVMLIYLLRYLGYDCILRFNNGKAITRKFILADTAQSQKTVDRAIHGLIEKGIVGKHKTTETYCYTVNPYIFAKGTEVDKGIAAFYVTTKWACK